MTKLTETVEFRRTLDREWKYWGPYLTERQWGTVREDYSPNGNAWEHFPHDHARSRAYRWGEDGIGGVSDVKQRLCFSVAVWNEKDPIIKERLFGLTGNEGNHGEDVKESYYYLDSTPTHSYMRMLYKYPQSEYPYAKLVEENRLRGKKEPEYDLFDTGIFQENRYFDLFIEYAKSAERDLLIRLTIINRGPDQAVAHLIPQLWFRNTWSWGDPGTKPELRAEGSEIRSDHPQLGSYRFAFEGSPDLLFCENETNGQRLFGLNGKQGFYKDGVNDFIVHNRTEAVNPDKRGTKAALRYRLPISAGGAATIRLRLTKDGAGDAFKDFEDAFNLRKSEADQFYAVLQEGNSDPDIKLVQRQGLAGLMWSKQYYFFDIKRWIEGDPGQPPPPAGRRLGRNSSWMHLTNSEIISMPDKWEYPWYAAWDLAFHCIPIAMIDPSFAKDQLTLLTREWYMHPNGQLPAYEWSFGDVNPPVHAWAAWRIYKIDQKLQGKTDRLFLERVFHKLLLNFTWWVNRKDAEGQNLFQGGFLGLDNIGIFDRSAPLPGGAHIEQSDGTAWMAMYSLNMMRIALELALENPAYQDLASKFFEHFLAIAKAMVNVGGHGVRLWDEEDAFYYDVLHTTDGQQIPLKIRSMVGLIPLFAVETLDPELSEQLPEFKARLEWFLENRPEMASLVSRWNEPGSGERRLLSLLRGHRMKKILSRMLDESEFLSDYGIRALSKVYEKPYGLELEGTRYEISYQPGESDTRLFGGNSNWRGPIWFPVNYLLIESLQRFHHYYGEDFRIECPTGSGKYLSIEQVAEEIAKRLCLLFLKDERGRRPVFGANEKLQSDPHFKDYPLFYEYFHGDSGRGVGAAHQTGWTALVAKLLQPRAKDHVVKKEQRPSSESNRNAEIQTG